MNLFPIIVGHFHVYLWYMWTQAMHYKDLKFFAFVIVFSSEVVNREVWFLPRVDKPIDLMVMSIQQKLFQDIFLLYNSLLENNGTTLLPKLVCLRYMLDTIGALYLRHKQRQVLGSRGVTSLQAATHTVGIDGCRLKCRPPKDIHLAIFFFCASIFTCIYHSYEVQKL